MSSCRMQRMVRVEEHTLHMPTVCNNDPVGDTLSPGAVDDQLRGLEQQVQSMEALGVQGNEAHLVEEVEEAFIDGKLDKIDKIEEVLAMTPSSDMKRAKKQRKNAIKISTTSVSTQCSSSSSLENWIEGVKGRLGYDEVQIRLIEEARHDVISFFEKSFEELGRKDYVRKSDELALTAASMLLGKLQGKNRENELMSSGCSKKSDLNGECVAKGEVENEYFDKDDGEECLVFEGDSDSGEYGEEKCDGENSEFGDESSPVNSEEEYVAGDDERSVNGNDEEFATNDEIESLANDELEDRYVEEEVEPEGEEEMGTENSINDEHTNEGVEEEGEFDPTEGRDEFGEYDDIDDNRMGIEEESNVDDGEYDEYAFNYDEWLDWLERGLRYVRGGT
nr:hypothetical protein Iba_scaffold5724CG0010 [Ipomoea batatas]